MRTLARSTCVAGLALATWAAAHAQPRAEARVAPDRAGGASYGAEETVPLDRVESRALDACRARLSRTGAPARASGALVAAARELARLAADGVADPVGSGRLLGALARALSYDPAPAAILVEGPDDGSAAGALARALPRGSYSHLGVGAFERDGIVHLVALAADRRARLSPFPRDVRPGTAAVLSGALRDGIVRPRVFVTLPSGLVREAGATGAKTFSARIEFPDPGRYVVEVLGEGPGGPEVDALLTVSAGGAPLDPPARPIASGAEPADAAAAEQAVIEAIDATRRRHGLSSLATAQELSALARRHSMAMAAAGRVAHALPGSGDPSERLRRAGIAYRSAYENVARAGTALGAHEASEESPAHLRNILRPDAARVGVGIARGVSASGGPSVYLTEIFLAPADDGATSRLTDDARVREELWRERARLRLAPLTADVALDALAREAATSMRARDDTEVPDLAGRALRLPRGIAAVDVFVATAPADATRSANLRDRRFRRVGVGVAKGDSRRFGPGRLWMAIVYTD